MPRVIRAPPLQVSNPQKKPRGTIGQYFATKHCPICEELTLDGICGHCIQDPQKAHITIFTRAREDEVAVNAIGDVSQNVSCVCESV